MTERPTAERDALEQLLRACDRAPIGALETGAIESALDDIGARIAALPRRATDERRRRWRLPRARLVIPIAAAVVTLGAGTAAATRLFIPTHTGKYIPRSEVDSVGPGEELNPRGTRFEQVELQESADIPYPPGYESWRRFVATSTARDSAVAAPCPRGVKGPCRVLVGTGELRGWFATNAFCAWVIDWRRATLAGDYARAGRDAKVIAGALRWKAIRAEDAHPNLTTRNDAGLLQPSLFGWMLPYQSAVRAGDLRKVDKLIRSRLFGNYFGLWDPGFHARSAGPNAYLRYLAGAGS